MKPLIVDECPFRANEFCLWSVRKMLLGGGDGPAGHEARPTSDRELRRCLSRVRCREPGVLCRRLAGGTCRIPRSRPRYDKELRELWVGDRLLCRLTSRASCLCRVLIAFQKRGWPRSVADPLSKDPHPGFRKELHDAVAGLNAAQHLIVFSCDGVQRRVRWEQKKVKKKGQNYYS